MAVRTRTSFLATGLVVALAACGGDDDGGVTVIDAAPIDAPIDAAIDAPPVCNAPSMVCAGECTDVTSNEQYCGDCNTACSGGEVCTASLCDCAEIEIPANPSFFMAQISNQLPGATLGIGPMSSGVGIDILVVAHATTGTVEDQAYVLDGNNLGTPPFAAYGYDIDLNNNFTPAAAYYATSGTLVFTKICPAVGGGMAGFEGTLTNATFQAVDSIMNPVIVPKGCFIGPVTTVTFSYGDVSCTNQ
jgi:hypothetical protein